MSITSQRNAGDLDSLAGRVAGLCQLRLDRTENGIGDCAYLDAAIAWSESKLAAARRVVDLDAASIDDLYGLPEAGRHFTPTQANDVVQCVRTLGYDALTPAAIAWLRERQSDRHNDDVEERAARRA